MQKHVLNELKTPFAGPEYSSRTEAAQGTVHVINRSSEAIACVA